MGIILLYYINHYYRTPWLFVCLMEPAAHHGWDPMGRQLTPGRWTAHHVRVPVHTCCGRLGLLKIGYSLLKRLLRLLRLLTVSNLKHWAWRFFLHFFNKRYSPIYHCAKFQTINPFLGFDLIWVYPAVIIMLWSLSPWLHTSPRSCGVPWSPLAPQRGLAAGAQQALTA